MEGDKNFGNILFLFFGVSVFERKWPEVFQTAGHLGKRDSVRIFFFI